MKLTKREYFRILHTIPKENIGRFNYWDGCNDMQGHNYCQSRTAKYVFSLDLKIGDSIDLEISGFRETTHFDKKEYLMKKFIKWTREFYNEKRG